MKKRLIMCCGIVVSTPKNKQQKKLLTVEYQDGTWLDSASGLMKGQLPLPSNVTRIAQAIKPVASDGISQVVYYQAGIGSTGSFFARVIGGATAEGLSENIRSAYTFVANNYADGDEIFLFGFSRGAFTARSVAGLIDGAGLLTKTGLSYLAEVFKDVENANNPSYRPSNPDIPFSNKPSASSPRYKNGLKKRDLTRTGILIQVVGVWDTVGSLGIPRVPWLEKLHLQTRSTKEYLFYDTKLNNNIINAYQALALDEHRSSFSPALWERPPGSTTNLRQVWFPGVHSNIGGGYPDQGMANITLAWMMSQVDSLIDFDEEYILDQFDETRAYYKKDGQKPRPWSFGEIYRSMTGIYLVGGTTTRTPGRYCEVDPVTGESTGQPLLETCEYVHPSARTRIQLHGPGVEDHGDYDCLALDGYKLRKPDEGRRTAMWTPRRGTEGKPLPESPLYRIERDLLHEDTKMSNYLLGPPGEPPPSARMSGALQGNDTNSL